MAGVVAVMCIAIARQAKPLCGDDATPASSISSTIDPVLATWNSAKLQECVGKLGF